MRNLMHKFSVVALAAMHLGSAFRLCDGVPTRPSTCAWFSQNTVSPQGDASSDSAANIV